MNLNTSLSIQSFISHEKPQKLIFMLHGYGDSAENFIHVANSFDDVNFKANYFALNAPEIIPNYPLGRQWFNLNPNGVYISEAGPKEILIIKSEILRANQMIENTMKEIIYKYNLSFNECVLMGFSQGGMMVFEFGNYLSSSLRCLAILSGRILDEETITNQSLLKTPIFISHGDKDDVLPIKVYDQACNFLKKNKLLYESYKLEGDSHTISPKAIKLLQEFIKKNFDVNES